MSAPISCEPERSAATECEPCRIFRCAKCRRWVSWDFGAADDSPDLCDDCAVMKVRLNRIRFTS